MTADEIICNQLVELVTDYLDGVLDPEPVDDPHVSSPLHSWWWRRP